MSANVTHENFSSRIIAAKTLLRRQIGDTNVALATMQRAIEADVEEVIALHNAGRSAVPELDFADLQRSGITSGQADLVRRRGCVVVRNVFDSAEVAQWNASIGEYIDSNAYQQKSASRVGMDRYFSQLASSRPQIFGLYWSHPQMQARQSPQLAAVRAQLNGLWQLTPGAEEFDPGRECLYADRLRRRQPGDTTLGLSPHSDGGSIERWIDPGYRKVYAQVYSSTPDQYQPFAAAARSETREIPSPAVCSMFRTYQGWTALTRQGPGEGTLNLVPVARAMGWILLRALCDDMPEDDLCGAEAGRALQVSPDYHAWLLRAYLPIPTVNPGDTVWWHPDLVHGVEDRHLGSTYSNVMYIGAAPDCAKNRAFLARQRPCFESGRSCPDFAPEDYEVDFTGRFTPDELSDLGRMQMGYG